MLVLMMGLPGSGKGQVARRLESIGFKSVATGKIIRDEIIRDTELGRQLKPAVDKAEYVDDETVLELVMEHLQGREILLEGFPRNEKQAKMLDEFLEDKSLKIDLVLHFDFNEQMMYERLKGRQICKQCQALYHEEKFPSADGKHCDVCGNELIHRLDDEPEKLKRKLEQYRTLIKPLIEKYKERGLVKVIDATASNIDMYYQVMQSHKNFMMRNY